MIKILLASSEVHPYSKTGGLADMAGALAKNLARQGQHVGMVTPLYPGVHERFPKLKRLDWDVKLPLGDRSVSAEVWTLEGEARVAFYFIRQPEFFDRPGLYQEKGREYADNAERFIFFSKCVTYLARHLPWRPELVHVHDWQTGLVPLLIRHQSLHEDWKAAPATCLTIHNLAYQGNFPETAYSFTNLPQGYFNPQGLEFFGSMSCLKAGIVFSDVITTVSPRYGREIMTPSFGCGLEGVLQNRRDAVFGILNGVDYSEWKTSRNRHLPHSYSIRNLRGKAANKAKLQKELGLPVRANVPLFASVSRLTCQKGTASLLGALEEMVSADLQFALLGSGDPPFEDAFRDLARRYPKKIAAYVGFDEGLSHRIEAGADFFVMPSRYEPCGLNQMYSQRYATIPIVRATGGLDDSVVDIRDDPANATGIKFSELASSALSRAIRKGVSLYQHPDLLRLFRLNGMKADFSWERTSEQYLRVYELGLSSLTHGKKTPAGSE